MNTGIENLRDVLGFSFLPLETGESSAVKIKRYLALIRLLISFILNVGKQHGFKNNYTSLFILNSKRKLGAWLSKVLSILPIEINPSVLSTVNKPRLPPNQQTKQTHRDPQPTMSNISGFN